MAKTYKAVEVAGPGNFRIVERPITPPSDEQVLIRVEACGICHTDSLTVEGSFPVLVFPECPVMKWPGVSKRLVPAPLNGV